MSTPGKINTILLNIKINRPKLVNKCGCKLAKFRGNILSLGENIANSFKGLLFDSHCMPGSEMGRTD